jgi:hypothetical protein
VKLSVGLSHNSTAWEQWCSQEGVPFSPVRFGAPHLPEEHAVIVVTAKPDREQSAAIEQYLRGGGAIIAYAPFAAGLGESNFRYEDVDYLLPGGKIADTGVLDLDARCAIPVESNALVTSAGSPALFVGPCWGGFRVLLPFDLSQVLQDVRATTRQFPADRERLPFERVSTVAKGEAFLLIGHLVELLFASRGLPLVRKARYPDGAKTVIAFRVDSDGGSQEEVEDLHELARKHETPISWFLDVKSHEPWIRAFANMEGDEVGLHCYEHRVFPDYQRNLGNIRRGIDVLSGAGFTTGGFAAPQGKWNEELAEAIDDSGFEYSSEFSYMYDGLPVFPETPTRAFATLQIPIHPVCIGSLNRVGYSESQMVHYFEGVVRRKLNRREPLFFYHHPKDRFPGAVDGLLGLLHDHGPRVTMDQFARWWNSRSEFSFAAATMQDSGIEMHDHTHNATGSVRLEIIRPDGSRTMASPANHIDLTECRWEAAVRNAGRAEQLRRARTFDLRTTLADIYTSVTRWSR